MVEIIIDEKLCIDCGACIALCTTMVFAEREQKTQVVSKQTCWLCGHCVAACPTDAIRHSAFPLETCPPVCANQLPSSDELVSLFRERRSLRVFDRLPVPRQVVEEIVEKARWVPSADNEQNVEWLALDEAHTIAQVSEVVVAVLDRAARRAHSPLCQLATSILRGGDAARADIEAASAFRQLSIRQAAGKDPVFFHAPVVLIAHTPRGKPCACENATYAAYALALMAQRYGLGTCHVGYFKDAVSRDRTVGRILEIPNNRQPVEALVLGYPMFPFKRLIPRRKPVITWGTRRNGS